AGVVSRRRVSLGRTARRLAPARLQRRPVHASQRAHRHGDAPGQARWQTAHTFRPGCRVTTVSWKHWPCLFPQHGPGRKHERPILLEDWQREIVERHPGDFLRGLFHSDGCRTRNWATRVVAGERRRYDYPRWEFVNRSDDILDLCTWALDLCEIGWRRPRVNAIAVLRRDDVRRLDELVGPK